MERDPAYSPDGRRIAFVRAIAGETNTSQIGIRELATGAVTLIESTLTPFTSGELAQPSWSPDGSQIGYATVPRDPKTDKVIDSQISVVQTDGTGLHRLNLPGRDAVGRHRLVPGRLADRPELVADQRVQRRTGERLQRAS